MHLQVAHKTYFSQDVPPSVTLIGEVTFEAKLPSDMLEATSSTIKEAFNDATFTDTCK